MKRLNLFIAAFLLTMVGFGQKGQIRAKLIDAQSKEPITKGIAILFGTAKGAETNSAGNIELTDIPTKQCEIIISDWDNKYMSFILTQIDLGKDSNEIDLGTIPLIKKSDPIELISNQCFKISGKSYKVEFVDGNYRYMQGKVAILYLDKPVTCE